MGGGAGEGQGGSGGGTGLTSTTEVSSPTTAPSGTATFSRANVAPVETRGIGLGAILGGAVVLVNL